MSKRDLCDMVHVQAGAVVDFLHDHEIAYLDRFELPDYIHSMVDQYGAESEPVATEKAAFYYVQIAEYFASKLGYSLSELEEEDQ